MIKNLYKTIKSVKRCFKKKKIISSKIVAVTQINYIRRL